MTATQYSLDNQSGTSHAHRRGSVRANLWAWRRYIILFATPILLSPLPAVVGSSEARCAYVVMLMAVYWFTEAIPVGVTALLPVVLFPCLGVMDTNTTSMLYMKDTSMLFIGGFFMAVSIEHWGLHRRIALRILMLVGSEPRWLMLGLMGATWFLSMWISNTATTAMMIPITEAIMQQLRGTMSESEGESSGPGATSTDQRNGPNKQTDTEMCELGVISFVGEGGEGESPNSQNGGPAETEVPAQKRGSDAQKRGSDAQKSGIDAEFERICKGMSLCICYAASCGGIGSLTGTGPNLILKESSDLLYSKSSLSNPVTFGSWLMFGIPMSLVVVVICWVWLQIAFLGRRGIFSCFGGSRQDPETSRRVKHLIRDEYKKLGSIVFGEGLLLGLFVLLVTLWVTRDMGGEVGWGQLFETDVKDSVPAILVGILLFILPSTLPCLSTYSDYSHPEKKDLTEPERKIIIRPLLHWKVVHQNMPWQLLFLLGGGSALSGAFNVSGLSEWIGDQLEFFRTWNEWAVLIIVCYIAAACTEVTSNMAIASVLLPIMQRLAAKVGAHPLLYMFPVCLSTSFAFMLPVATPPNAIVFTYGRIKMADMAKAGAIMNLISVPLVVFMTKTLGKSVFGYDENPMDFPLNATQLMPSYI